MSRALTFHVLRVRHHGESDPKGRVYFVTPHELAELRQEAERTERHIGDRPFEWWYDNLGETVLLGPMDPDSEG